MKAQRTVVSPGTERAQLLALPNTSVTFPHVPGYSGCGHVVSPPASDGRYEAGQPVAVLWMRHASVGAHPADNLLDASGLPTASAATATAGMMMYQAVRRLSISASDRVCVIGSGFMGLLTERLARAAGARETVVVARTSLRREAAIRGGCGQFIAIEETPSAVREVGASIVFDVTGAPDALEVASSAAACGATVVILGSPRGVSVVPVGDLQRRNLRIVGAHAGLVDVESALLGYDVRVRDAQEYLALLRRQEVLVDDLFDVVAEPTAAADLYRRVALDPALTGAAFDWRTTVEGTAIQPVLRRSRRRAKQADVVRFAIVGCGDIGIRNADAVAESKLGRVAACFDMTPSLADEVARRYNCRRFDDYDSLLDSADVDVVVLSLPHDLHTGFATAALVAGKHVVVEKPLAHTLSSAAALREAAANSDRSVAVCLPQRFTPETVEIARLIEAGATGPCAGFLIKHFQDKPLSYFHGGFSGRARSSWRLDRERSGGGVLIMNLIHNLDIALQAMRSQAVSVAAHEHRPSYLQVEDGIAVTLGFESGATGVLVAGVAVPGLSDHDEDELRIWGPNGQLIWDTALRVFTDHDVASYQGGEWSIYQPPTRSQSARSLFFEHMADSLEDAEQSNALLDGAFEVQRIVEAAYLSVKEQRIVDPRELG